MELKTKNWDWVGDRFLATPTITANRYMGNQSFAKGSKEMKCRVLIADDHGVVRKGLRLLLEQYPELVVIGEASNGREAATMAAALSPQIVVMDVAMPILNGIEAAEQILKTTARPASSCSRCTRTRAMC
jgi:PleD family two-component response regulator